MIIQIVGLPGSGKTSLANALKNRINAIHLNADDVRCTVNSDLGFSLKDRIEHSRRMGEMARMLSRQDFDVIVDFICPTKEAREVFGKADIFIFMNTIREGRFEDTNKIFQKPEKYDFMFDSHQLDEEEKASAIISAFGLHDWSAPTTLMLGRFQPWHEGHHALYQEGKKRNNQVMLGIRNTYKTSQKDPLTFNQVKYCINQDSSMNDAMLIRMPNITHVIYGRDVGYKIEQIELSKEIESISATQKRKEMGYE